MANHMYHPLVTGTEIRLLCLHPGEETSQIYADLVNTDLASPERYAYEAISYTWDAPVDERIISLNGTPVKIRFNLWSFLTRLRPTSGRPRHLWCDALCIDQSNLREKSDQVRMIGHTFAKADRVLAWVGEHANGSEALFQHRRKSQGRIQKKTQRNDQILMVDQWTSFLNRPYWSRSWIVQEIVLARSVVVFCGGDQMDWNDLLPSWAKIWGAVIYVNAKMIPRDFRNVTSRLHTINVERTMHHAERLMHGFDFYIFPSLGESILGVSKKFGDTKCSDPRDKVFAFLQLERRPSVLRHYLVKLSLMREIPEIYPDYEMSTVDLFISLSCSRLIPGHIPSQASRYIAALFRNLQLDQRDAPKVTEFLLDSFNHGHVRHAVFRTIALALDDCGAFGQTLFPSKRLRLGSFSSIKEALEKWKLAHQSMNDRHTFNSSISCLPST